jgi:uncharacterized membrane protein
MDGYMGEVLDSLFRWAHVVVGVLWIGLLYYFNWVNGVFAKQLDAETKQKAMPELLPRVLYFFRWGAAFTWITGLLLLALVYYHGKQMTGGGPEESKMLMIGVATFLGGAVIYDVMWKKFQDNEQMGVIISYILVVAILYVLSEHTQMAKRAIWIHLGALFGTCMAMNVWMRIWPAQRKIIAGIKSGEAADPSHGKLAGLRSKHNTYMSVPLIFIMLVQHHATHMDKATEEGTNLGWIILSGVVAIGWLATNWVYKKSRTDAPAQY